MPSIGSFNFIRLRGGPNPTAEVPQEITRPNLDGHAYRKFGKRGARDLYTSTVDVATGSIKTTIDGYRALQGTLVTLTDEAGSVYNNVMVIAVNVASPFIVHNCVGGEASGNDRYVLQARWELQHTEVS